MKGADMPPAIPDPPTADTPGETAAGIPSAMAAAAEPAAGQPSGSARNRPTPAAVKSVVTRYHRTRRRIDNSAAGHLQRRVAEIDLMNQAMILAAMAFMLLIPALVSLQALIPLGASGAAAASVATRLGLSAAATHDLQQLFPGRNTVRGATTFVSVAVTLISAFSWPAALQRGYELAWGQPSLGRAGLWRCLVWLAVFIVFGTVWAGSGPLVTGWLHASALVALGLPLAVGWSWWTQHLLLGRRIGWRLLLPGAIAMGVGLVALRLAAGLYLSTTITQHYHQYGPLGIVFVLLSWLIAFSVVMLGGALIGVVVYERRQRRERPS
jgi:membrane protein